MQGSMIGILFICLSVNLFAQSSKNLEQPQAFNAPITLESMIKTYPSPVKDVLYIEVKKEVRLTTILVLNLVGKVVLREEPGEIQSKIRVDMSHERSEIYLLQLTASDGRKMSKRIVKQ